MLRTVGDPQHRYPTVHVTGTSGKGSTAAAVAAILTAAGYRVGLHTSPYLQVATEKLQIGPSLIDACSFAETVARVLGTATGLFRCGQGTLPFSHAEAWSVLAYWWFADREVDVAVVEVGAGGRFDATNVINPIVSVITSVGLDHLLTHGPNISDIAWHKAGIIKPGSTAVIGALHPEAFSVIAEEAKSSSVELIQAHGLDSSLRGVPLDVGGFHGRNAGVAAAVATLLAQRGFQISDAAIDVGISSGRLPGRLELMPGTAEPAVWIDGAHNEDKVAALTREAVSRFGRDKPPVVVFGMLSGKDSSGVLARLGTAASSIVTTEAPVIGKASLSADRLAEAAIASGFTGAVHVEPDPDAAVRYGEDVAKREDASVLVTGSMYLAGQVRRRWFRDQDVVLQRSPWAVNESRLGPTRPFGGLVRDKADGESDDATDHQVSAGVDEQVVR
jgi:dihydrofolate synthase / folylpolyglutamate synthase